MNKLRLLAGMLCATLLSGGAHAQTRRVFTLEEIFKTAESNNMHLKATLAAEEEANRAIDVARAGRLPDIETSLSLSYIGDGFTTKRDFSDYQKADIPHFGDGLAISVDQPLYTGGFLTGSIALAEMKAASARHSTELRRDNLRFELTGYYLDIYKCRNLRKVIESNIASAKKVLAEIQARYEQGTVLKNDITRYELLLSNLQLQLTKTDNTLAILNNNLVTTAGLEPGITVLPDSAILSRSLPAQSESAWQESAIVNSPSLQIARTGVDISRKTEDIVNAGRLPKVGLKAEWTLNGPILTEIPPINRTLSYWFVGVGVSYNLSSLYKNNHERAKARAATVRAEQEYEALTDDTGREIRADYIRYLEAYEELKTQEKSVELAQQNYNTIFTRYSEGMALITDMLDAADSRLDAQQRLVNARIGVIYYYYKLLFISGKI